MVRINQGSEGVDKINIIGIFNFGLLLKGSDLGWSFGNCWSLRRCFT